MAVLRIIQLAFTLFLIDSCFARKKIMNIIHDRVLPEHDFPSRLIIRTRRQADLIELDYAKDRSEAARIRSLIADKSNNLRVPRNDNEDDAKSVLHKLDQSVEDKWKLNQNAHLYDRSKRSGFHKKLFFPLNSLAARIAVPAGPQIRSVKESSTVESKRAPVEEKRALILPASIMPYEHSDQYVEKRRSEIWFVDSMRLWFDGWNNVVGVVFEFLFVQT